MDLVRLPARPADWDTLIRGYRSKTLFHEACWLDHVTDIHPGSAIEYFEIRDGGRVVGYWCAQRVRKVVLTVYGSPLPGTGTNYMGPLVNEDVDQRELLRAFVRACRRRFVAHVELANPRLDEQSVSAAGFEVHRGVTHVVPLPGTEEEAWGELKSACRNRVKKATKNALVVEITDDPSIVADFHAQFTEVYAKQGMVTPFTIDRPRSLFARLAPAGRLLPIRITHEGAVIASGLFPFDERAVYFWGAASWLKDQHLCPNELLHWSVIREAIARRIPEYNMCGGTSQFKDKFGGSDVPYNHYSRSFLPGLGHARAFYQRMHWRRLRRAGAAIERPTRPPTKADEPGVGDEQNAADS